MHIYRAIALKTADVFLNNISFSKGAMHDEFVGAPKEFRVYLPCLPRAWLKTIFAGGIFDGDGDAMGDLISAVYQSWMIALMMVTLWTSTSNPL